MMSCWRPNAFLLGVILLVFGPALASPSRAGESDLREELELARKDFEQGGYFRAADLLRELLEEVPDSVEVLALLLRVEMEQGNTEEAEEIEQRLIELGEPARQRVALLARADHAFGRGRVEESEALARSALQLDGSDLLAHSVVARALHERGLREDAYRLGESVLKDLSLERLDSDGLLAAGRLYRTMGEWEQAARCCVHAEQKRKQEGRPKTDVLLLLGDLYRLAKSMTGETPRAFKTYRDALRENSALVAAKVGRALVHLYVNDSWKAEKEIDEALTINRNSVEALSVKAWIRVLDGQFSEALELLDSALEVNPNAKKSLAIRAAALHLLDRAQAYQETVDRVLAIDPSYGEVFHVVGDALSRHLRFADSVPFQRRAVEVDPGLAMAYISLGRDLCFTGAEQEGWDVLEESFRLHPFPHPWRANMQQVLKKLDREFLDTDTERFRIRVHVDENPILGPRLEQAFESDLDMLAARYQWTPPETVLVEMLPNHQDFSVRSVGFVGLGAVGACFGNFLTLLSPRAGMARRTFVWRRTALHELTHVITIGRSKGRVPRWLTEGLSVYEERVADLTWARDLDHELVNAYANDNLMKLREFNKHFRGPRIAFAYYQGGLWAEYVTERFGFDRILETLDAFADNLETPEVIERVFDMTAEEMDEDFAGYVFETRIEGTRVQPAYGARKRSEFRRKLRKDRENLGLLVDAAWAYYQADKKVDSDVFLDRAFKLDPAHPGALRLAAHRAIDRGRPDLARENLETAFRNGGQEYHAALLLAQLQRAQEDHDQAEETLRIARDCFPAGIGPGNPYLGMYELLMARGEKDEALEWLTDYLKRDETAVKPRLEMATHLQAEARHDEAMDFLREAEQVDPFVREVYVRQGTSLRALGQPAEAVAILRTALLVDPRLEPGYASRPPGAIPEIGDEEQQQADILITIAEIEHEAGDTAAALRDLERARRLVPDSPRAEELMEKLRT